MLIPPFTQRKEYDHWLAGESDMSGHFQSWLSARNVQVSQNELMVTLDTLESALLSSFETPEEIELRENHAVFDGAARYLGSQIIESGKAKWGFSHEDPEDVWFGYPILVFGDGMEESPHLLISTLLDRREPGFLSGVVEYLLS